jgi:hypothetical protein
MKNIQQLIESIDKGIRRHERRNERPREELEIKREVAS